MCLLTAWLAKNSTPPMRKHMHWQRIHNWWGHEVSRTLWKHMDWQRPRRMAETTVKTHGKDPDAPNAKTHALIADPLSKNSTPPMRKHMHWQRIHNWWGHEVSRTLWKHMDWQRPRRMAETTVKTHGKDPDAPNAKTHALIADPLSSDCAVKGEGIQPLPCPFTPPLQGEDLDFIAR